MVAYVLCLQMCQKVLAARHIIKFIVYRSLKNKQNREINTRSVLLYIENNSLKYLHISVQ